MKRWDLAEQGDTTLTEFLDGAYVRFEDVQAELERLQPKSRPAECAYPDCIGDCQVICRARNPTLKDRA
jgi:hypothetical protein